METRRETENGCCRLWLEGEMTIYEAAALKTVFAEALEGGPEIEVNLAGVTEMDTAGVQLLIAAKREALVREKLLRLTAHSPAVVGAIDLLGLSGYFGDLMVIPANH